MGEVIVILAIILVAVVLLRAVSRRRAKENGARERGGGSTATRPAPSDRAASAQRITPPTRSARNIGEVLPTIGELGTATPAQLEAVNGVFGNDTPADLSFEQASLILDAREYVRAMIDVLERENERVDEYSILPATVAFIIGEEAIREYVHKWGRGRFERGTHHETPRLRRNDTFAIVRNFVLQHPAPR